MAIREIFIIFAAMNTMKSLSLLLFALTAVTCAQDFSCLYYIKKRSHGKKKDALLKEFS